MGRVRQPPIWGGDPPRDPPARQQRLNRGTWLGPGPPRGRGGQRPEGGGRQAIRGPRWLGRTPGGRRKTRGQGPGTDQEAGHSRTVNAEKTGPGRGEDPAGTGAPASNRVPESGYQGSGASLVPGIRAGPLPRQGPPVMPGTPNARALPVQPGRNRGRLMDGHAKTGRIGEARGPPEHGAWALGRSAALRGPGPRAIRQGPGVGLEGNQSAGGLPSGAGPFGKNYFGYRTPPRRTRIEVRKAADEGRESLGGRKHGKRLKGEEKSGQGAGREATVSGICKTKDWMKTMRRDQTLYQAGKTAWKPCGYVGVVTSWAGAGVRGRRPVKKRSRGGRALPRPGRKSKAARQGGGPSTPGKRNTPGPGAKANTRKTKNSPAAYHGHHMTEGHMLTGKRHGGGE